MAFLEVNSFSFQIENNYILNNISFSVEEGEYISVVGPNGAGKSTLLKCLDRIWSGGEGEIKINGKQLKKYSQKELAKIVSYVPQMESIVYPFTVEEFVLMGLYPHLTPFSFLSQEQWNRVSFALERVGMAGFTKRSINTLSGGERQKVLIAASLVQGARLLLLDEPTAYLDPKHQTEIYSILEAVNKQSHVAIIMVTHDLNHAVLMSKRVIGLTKGAIVYDGNTNDIMNNDILKKLYQKDFLFLPHPQTNCLITVPEILQS